VESNPIKALLAASGPPANRADRPGMRGVTIPVKGDGALLSLRWVSTAGNLALTWSTEASAACIGSV